MRTRLGQRREPVSPAEIANDVKRSPATVQNWTRHPDWPSPIGKRGHSYLYAPREAEDWVYSHVLWPPLDGSPPELLTAAQITTALGWADSTIPALISRGRWPRPDQESHGQRRWRRATVNTYLETHRRRTDMTNTADAPAKPRTTPPRRVPPPPPPADTRAAAVEQLQERLRLLPARVRLADLATAAERDPAYVRKFWATQTGFPPITGTGPRGVKEYDRDAVADWCAAKNLGVKINPAHAARGNRRELLDTDQLAARLGYANRSAIHLHMVNSPPDDPYPDADDTGRRVWGDVLDWYKRQERAKERARKATAARTATHWA